MIILRGTLQAIGAPCCADRAASIRPSPRWLARPLGAGLFLPVPAFAPEWPAVLSVMHHKMKTDAPIEREVVIDHEFRCVRGVPIVFAIFEAQRSRVLPRIIGVLAHPRCRAQAAATCTVCLSYVGPPNGPQDRQLR
jgi:hypothetical protein